MDESAIEPYSGRQNSWQKQTNWKKYRDHLYQERAHTSMDVEDSDSSSEVEDDDAEGVTPQIEKDFFKTLSYVKSRDPKIYDRDNTFYQSDESSSETGEEVTSGKKQNNTKEKPMYLKDYERKIILEKGGQYSDDDSDDAVAKQDSDAERDKREASPTYVEEQQQIRDSFHTVLENEDSESDDGLLTTKKKTKQEKNEEESDYKKWLKGETDETEEGKEMGALRTFWTDPDLDEGEKFLRNYILNREYVNKDDQESSDSADASDEEDDDADGPRFSEDEQALNEQDNFERKFNFRYEEPDADFVKRFPRTISSSVRRKDTSRKEKRKERDQRKDEEKQRKHDELKQVKNVKRREILDKLDQLREATGNAKIGFDADDLEEDFDPDKHDKMMQEIFNEGYDAEADEGVKPEFGEEFDEENYGEQDEEEYGDGSHGDDYQGDDGNYGDEEELEPHCDDPDFIMDADYDPSVTKKSKKEKRESSKKKNRKNAGFGDVVKTDKPTFDPADKTFDEYMDEYYKLDYEDIIDDLPCRFKYRTVLPNDFGLTVEEVLSAKDKELNQWVSVKKASQYRSKDEEVHDIRLFRRRAKNEQFKMKVFQSFMEEKSDEDENEGDDENEDEQEEKPEDVAEENQEEPASTSQQDSPEKKSDKPVQETKKKRRRKKRNQSGPPPNEEKADDSDHSPQKHMDDDGDDKRDTTGKLVGADDGVKTRMESNTEQKQDKMEESKMADDHDSEKEQVERTTDHSIQAKNVKKRKRNRKNRAVGNVSGDSSEKNNNTERTEQTVNVNKVGDDQESPSKKKRKNLENRQPTSSSIHESGKDITSHKELVKPSTHVAKGHNRPSNQSGKTKLLSKNRKGPGGNKHSAGGFKGGSNGKQGHLEMFKKGGQSLRHKQQTSNQRNANSKGGMTHSGTGHFTGKKGGMSHSKIGKFSPGAKEEKESKLTEDSEGKKKRNRKKKRGAGQSSDPVSKISEARLKAYGVNPKKIRFQLEYQKQKQEGQR